MALDNDEVIRRRMRPFQPDDDMLMRQRGFLSRAAVRLVICAQPPSGAKHGDDILINCDEGAITAKRLQASDLTEENSAFG